MQNLGILFILTNLVSVTAFMSGITLIADYACLISSSSSEKHEVRLLNPSVDALHFLDMDHFRTLTPCDDFDSTLDSILSHSPDTDAELVNWVDCENNKIKTLTRSMIHKYNILHSGAGILPVKGQQIYCHQRSPDKRIFPNLLDMFVGGVSQSGEESRVTASREMSEELNLSSPSSLSEKLFTTTICTSYNRCIVDCFQYDIAPSESSNIILQESEVQWGGFMDEKWINSAVDAGAADPDIIQQLRDMKINNNENEWVPDGKLVWQAWQAHHQKPNNQQRK
ncbi:hypothetical protein TrVE_jg10941 [Triparma verrucosa]|uniref:Nudix hydrolase domain-containing protein n=1 Tax=Triparma verrucosa TaxID=1606542 RepID=A0A9W7BJ63_9STRA|nr:hypothetical protein TrVE_jg10941 [Triparma verrucosa]